MFNEYNIVEYLRLYFFQELKYIARYPRSHTKLVRTELGKLTLEGVDCGGSKSWTGNFPIPEMPFFNLYACSIIDLKYELSVRQFSLLFITLFGVIVYNAIIA